MSQRGKPFEKGNQFGKGRPPGSLNKKSLECEELLLESGEELLDIAIDRAIEGHPGARKLLVERLVPRLKDVDGLPVEQSPEPPFRPWIQFVDADGNRLWDMEKNFNKREIPEHAR